MSTYIRLRDGEELPDIEGLRPFRAVVVVEEPVSSEWRHRVSRWMVDSGCLYMMAWGRDCSSWDDSVDLATLEAGDFADIPDDDFVMTTWHEDEPLEEVLWFSKHLARHPAIELGETLILHIGPGDRAAEFRESYRRA